MSNNLSLVKCAKKGRFSIIWQRYINCQVNTAEHLTISTAKGISTFIAAVEQRNESVYRRLVGEIQSIQNVPIHKVKYHKTCNRTKILLQMTLS